ncbi:type II toxin-antitoxin system RelE/ParE family toxin [cf. Phormidesmis sp. LEGE 11477]|uniref:type II toxin-antitoxin system RelE/ParE family toxin n=1 Tax=cf. Phormidesmis sp. LEGE 11477 TaxID=1828680 RepID=UPI001881106A|nr:type II toxin-antitoxin system RelE/ParE family toxin [cf. Phormidesmis sp. LEGE 11477]MBE9064141.1 type II toxin-antitoxin system RelE/ParE family toxin [cf. Phormidesmis sp. LEGE 11477]
MRVLRITVPASQDLGEISDYFLERSVDAGERFVKAFDQKCQYIARFPFIGKPYDTISPGLRGLKLMSYIVFYSVSENDVSILRVVSGYRDLQDVFSE